MMQTGAFRTPAARTGVASGPAPRMRKGWLLALGLFQLMCAAGMVAVQASAPAAATRVAVVFPPWYGQGRVLTALSRADARLVRFGRVGWIAVVAAAPADAPASGAASAAPLRRALATAGALAFLDPRVIGACDDTVSGSQTLPRQTATGQIAKTQIAKAQATPGHILRLAALFTPTPATSSTAARHDVLQR